MVNDQWSHGNQQGNACMCHAEAHGGTEADADGTWSVTMGHTATSGAMHLVAVIWHWPRYCGTTGDVVDERSYEIV